MMQERDATTPIDAAIVFIVKQRGAMRIAALSPAAVALGLVPGMALADARAQIPDMATAVHDPEADALWLEKIADCCEQYTPAVAVDAPDAIVLDITGCIHLYGTETKLIADIRAKLARIHLRIAAFSTPEGALALARFGCVQERRKEAVGALPVAALRLEDSLETALRRAGLLTIGDLARRPVAPLAARFGAPTVSALERLLGRADSRIIPRHQPPPLTVERRFAEPLVTIEAALLVLEELVAEAAEQLEQRGRGARQFKARFYRSDGAVSDLAVETGQPTRAPAVLARLFRERIDGLSDPLDPGFGFDMVRLSVLALEPLLSTQLLLEGDNDREEILAALIDRLGARLGRHRVRRFASRNSHVPEKAYRTFAAVTAPHFQEEWQSTAAGEPPRRPLHLFDPPQRIEVIARVPDEPPRRFFWRRTAHDVTRYEGPERISGEWWHEDKTSPTRDYYRIEDTNGRRFWIFRDGLYTDAAALPTWYLHGLFV